MVLLLVASSIFVLMTTSCPFCSYAAGLFTKDLIVFEDEHVLVIPCRGQKHRNRGARASKRAFGADGVSLRQNNDSASGQDVFHLHFHIVPRFLGDDFDTSSYATVDERLRIEQAEALRRAWPQNADDYSKGSAAGA
jgi:diadenosine tetraphosphate (Ap4A) HIT family hydrolase